MRQRERRSETDRAGLGKLCEFRERARLLRPREQRGQLEIRQLPKVTLAVDARRDIDGADAESVVS